MTPEQVRPYPKAKPRVLSGRGSKKGSTKIFTNTPVKRQIEEHEAKRKDKKAQGDGARGKVGTVGRAEKANKDLTTKKLFVDSEGSDDEKMILDGDSDDSMKLGESEDESEKEEEIFDSVSTGDFVKVVYKAEYFPGSVQKKNKNSVRVRVTCMAGLRKWKWLDREDPIFYPREDILKRLLPPTPAPDTAPRAASYFVFANWYSSLMLKLFLLLMLNFYCSFYTKNSHGFLPIHESFYYVPEYTTSCPKLYHPWYLVGKMV